MAAKKKQSFEDKLTAVEQLISQLEEGNVSLEETLTRYENGMKMLGELEKELESATQRLTVLRRGADGSIREEDAEAEV